MLLMVQKIFSSAGSEAFRAGDSNTTALLRIVAGCVRSLYDHRGLSSDSWNINGSGVSKWFLEHDAGLHSHRNSNQQGLSHRGYAVDSCAAIR